MDFINIAKKRHSVRSYTNQKVEPEKLEQILEAAHVAPTAANLQPVHLLVVQSEEGLAKPVFSLRSHIRLLHTHGPDCVQDSDDRNTYVSEYRRPHICIPQSA